MICPKCNGKGEYQVTVEWSDGLGLSSEICSLCDGAREIDSLLKMADDFKRIAGERSKELRNLKVSVALYLATMDGKGNTPAPALKDAPRPYRWPDRWLQNLKEAASTLEVLA